MLNSRHRRWKSAKFTSEHHAQFPDSGFRPCVINQFGTEVESRWLGQARLARTRCSWWNDLNLWQCRYLRRRDSGCRCPRGYFSCVVVPRHPHLEMVAEYNFGPVTWHCSRTVCPNWAITLWACLPYCARGLKQGIRFRETRPRNRKPLPRLPRQKPNRRNVKPAPSIFCEEPDSGILPAISPRRGFAARLNRHQSREE